MSVDYVILSPLAPAELERVEEQCRERLAAWYEDHEDAGDEIGEFAMGGFIPSPSEAEDMVKLPDDGGQAPPGSKQTKAVLERLRTIRSAITIERPGNLDLDRMQVSILKFLVERAGKGLVLFVDALELSESALRYLRTKQAMPGFESDGAAEERVERAASAESEKQSDITPIEKAAKLFVERLRDEELLTVDDTFELESACNAVLRALERIERRGGTRTDAIADALLDVPGVDDMYADDDTLQAHLRAAFG